MGFHDGSGNTVLANTVSSVHSGAAIAAGGSDHLVANNIVFDSERGIVSHAGQNQVVRHNNISNTFSGIDLSVNNSVIDSNKVEVTKGTAISVGQSRNSLISNNFLSGTSETASVGIDLHPQAQNNTVTGNTITNFGEAGVVSDRLSENNLLYVNNLINNQNQTLENGNKR
jgi:hypothetical protein